MLNAMKNVAFLLPTGANIASLETARHGFLVANDYLAAQGREPQFQVRTLALTREVSLDDGRIKVQADLVLADASHIDICIAPPLLGTVSDVVLSNRELIEWLSRHYRSGGEVASLCMGAALLAAGGVLDGQQAVVHWVAQNLYATLFPNVRWISDRVVMAENGVYTSGGAFSAAHLVLHLIEKYTDRDTAIWCAKYFQLDWSRQSQLPFSVFMGQKAHADDVVRAVQSYIERCYTEKITVEALAERHSLGRRTLERRFRQATGNSIVQYLQRVRVEAAKKRLESSRKSVAQVMYEVGYNDTKAFRDIFSKHCGMSPVGYRDRYQ
ncbi:GlxA family transcriptional regulator [Achromobacter piechaudii]|uniref:Transcriptional regulator, AraC family n=1 Tax=Achromobacter piechaudii ATCC 43553 TaxID=742159 RepID=D4XFR5_9BURK|nr:helix-turn-helix domain-containing protein [Achromobacter piechaudii]EFF74357.1 transcriptional regulator, AraC family [Achromobacter piechaudii ATCC 43553]